MYPYENTVSPCIPSLSNELICCVDQCRFGRTYCRWELESSDVHVQPTISHQSQTGSIQGDFRHIGKDKVHSYRRCQDQLQPQALVEQREARDRVCEHHSLQIAICSYTMPCRVEAQEVVADSGEYRYGRTSFAKSDLAGKSRGSFGGS